MVVHRIFQDCWAYLRIAKGKHLNDGMARYANIKVVIDPVDVGGADRQRVEVNVRTGAPIERRVKS
uniref:Uncharacterized protein n=1 Tax=mine drainage metagenome TaxID=410659 RepID=E6Q2S0_9ZZZZ